jgi:hypothetical protein
MSAFRSTLCLAALPLAALIAAAPASAQTKDHAPVALKSSSKMTQDKANSESWTYVQPREVFIKYRTVIVDPTAVYQGADAQFDGIDSADRYKAASVITDELRKELIKTFPSPAKPQADTLRLKVTILGATKTKGGIATATRARSRAYLASPAPSPAPYFSPSSFTTRRPTSCCWPQFAAARPIRSMCRQRSPRTKPSSPSHANSPTARASASKT